MLVKPLFAAISLFLLLSNVHATVGDSVGLVVSTDQAKVQKGMFVFIAPNDRKIIEVNEGGGITWEYQIPNNVIQDGRIFAGSDVEWIKDSDTFLFEIPGSGAFEVNRAKEIVWQYRTKFISHDTDKLSNGNVIFVNGWDSMNDPLVTEVTRDGRVVRELRIGDFPLDPKDSSMQEQTVAHTNSVAVQEDGSILVSFRNFGQVLLMKDGKEIKRWTNIGNVHDPELLTDSLIACNHGDESKRKQFIERIANDGSRSEVGVVREKELAPLRSCSVLPNGNYLATGSTALLQFTPQGELVWRLNLNGFVHQRSAGKSRNFLYKATFVRPD